MADVFFIHRWAFNIFNFLYSIRLMPCFCCFVDTQKIVFFSSFVLALYTKKCVFFSVFTFYSESVVLVYVFFPAFSPITLLRIIIPVAYLCVYTQRSTNLRRENPLKTILFRSVLFSSFLLCSVLFNVVVFLYCVKTKRNWFQWIFIRDL